MPVKLSLDTDFVPLHFKEPFLSILPNEANDSTIVVKTHLNSESCKAPVKKGQVLGKAEVYYAEKLIGTVDLVAGTDVKSSGILSVAEHIKSFFTSIYMKILLLVVVAAIIIFIILCIWLNYSKIRSRRTKFKPYKYGRNKNDKS